MIDEAYPLQETGRDEEFLFFSDNTEDQACVGHLRGDFGSGTEFWTTWYDHNKELKSQKFKNELDRMVNALRRGGPLKDLSSMERFCRCHTQARMSPESGAEYYGFRVDTDEYRYYLRGRPLRKNYNVYIYCYQTDKFERAADLPPRESGVNYNLASIKNIAATAKLVRQRAAQEPDQSSYNAAWLHGYADALDEVAKQLEPQRGLEAATNKNMNRRIRPTYER